MEKSEEKLLKGSGDDADKNFKLMVGKDRYRQSQVAAETPDADDEDEYYSESDEGIDEN